MLIEISSDMNCTVDFITCGASKHNFLGKSQGNKAILWKNAARTEEEKIVGITKC